MNKFTLLSLTQDNDFYRNDLGLSALPYFVAGLLLILLILHLVEDKK